MKDETRINKRSRAAGQHPPSRAEKIRLKKDDLIQINLDEDEWLGATVIDRAKVSGKYYNYFNVLGEDGLERNVDLEQLEFRKVTEEEVNMVHIPREEQNSEECRNAKVFELEKLLTVLKKWRTRVNTGYLVDGFCGGKEQRCGLGW